jgi:uncharacterized protein (TIGR03437 family)
LNLQAHAPQFTPEGIVSAASFRREAVSPGSIISVFGLHLSRGTQAGEVVSIPSSLLINFTKGLASIPTNINGTTVKINGSKGAILAPLFYVSPLQINLQIPYELQGNTTATMIIENSGLKSQPVTFNLTRNNPGIFTFNQQGTGAGAILHNNGTRVDTSHPARPGEYVQIYLTGLGPLDKTIRTGHAANSTGNPLYHTADTPQVTVGGASVPVLYSGLAPGFVALYQINIFLPTGIPIGDAVPVKVTIGGRQSNTITMNVASAIT